MVRRETRYAVIVLFLLLVWCSGFIPMTNTRAKRRDSVYRCNSVSVPFSQYKEIPQWLRESCATLGYEKPTIVQERSFSDILAGKDVLIQAQTGSGKTLAYCLPILSSIDPCRSAIQVVIVVPTRELALQVTKELRKLCSTCKPKIQVMTVMSGSINKRQQIWASVEPPHIVVGNPSALQSLVDMGKLRLNSVSYVVVDEVDACFSNDDTRQELHRLLSRHLSNSFQYPAADDDGGDALVKGRGVKILGASKPNMFRNKRQTIMCSATIPQRKHFPSLCFQSGWTESIPELINISQDQILPEQLTHECIPCIPEERLGITAYLVKQHWKVYHNTTTSNQMIIFADKEENLRIYLDYLTAYLRKAFPDDPLIKSQEDNMKTFLTVLTSTMDVQERKYALERFRSGESKLLLCTDLASRGLDIPATGLVVQMAVPKNADLYVHRAGRTGRMDRMGKVVTLMQTSEEFVIKRFMNELGFVMKKRLLAEKKV